MTVASNITWQPYAGLISSIETDSCYCLKLKPNWQPNEAAQAVARIRHQVKLPLIVEIAADQHNGNGRLIRLAQAAAAAGANIILLVATSFPAAKAALSALNSAVTLPLFVNCPTANTFQRQQLRSLGAEKILPPD
ncbi:MAG: hypothetical protein GX952_03760 [Firmicutes bacterium]|nr:hypothetical protein [Bacillota bacterium]